MAWYIIRKTYSLQLAVAYIQMTDNYANDYKAIFEKMNQVKSDMIVSRLLGTLPIMESELKTGLPVSVLPDQTIDKNCVMVSRETYLK